MEKDLNKIVKRLLRISQLILDKFVVMATLSYNDMEESEEYNNHLEDTKEYLNAEAVILNNLNSNELINLFKLLKNYDDESTAYDRLYVIIDNRIEDFYQDECTDLDDSDDSFEYESNDDNNLSDDYIHKYYLDTGMLEKYELDAINYISIKALKNMKNRISMTYSDNKIDNKFKKRLIKNLKLFKYIVLGIDVNMEKIGVYNRFNIDKIPYINKPNIDISTIAYNQCIVHLDKLYSITRDQFDVNEVNENLFNMMCLEEFLDEMDNELLNKLISLCDELESHNNYPYYGNIAKEKILLKTKN